MNNIVYIMDSQSDLAVKTWEYWCEKNNCDLIIELPKNLDSIDKLAIVSSEGFIHWAWPNFFDFRFPSPQIIPPSVWFVLSVF